MVLLPAGRARRRSCGAQRIALGPGSGRRGCRAGQRPAAGCKSATQGPSGVGSVLPKLRVLFLCTGNSCRSQMAEGWARHLKGDVIEPYSAGIETHGLNPRAVQVMAEAGVDISGQRSKHVDELRDVPFDYVVTVCDHAHESCPLFPGRTKLIHVGFDDPPRLAREAKTEEDALRHYRRVRDEIRAFVGQLPGALENALKQGS
ncbi:MAG: arsenate reductase ArsC [Phycisphaerae bacterium]|nr:arsenate reductase ArsC [Phycisphaerae bacterium]